VKIGEGQSVGLGEGLHVLESMKILFIIVFLKYYLLSLI